MKYVCGVCGYVYDPEEGDPDNDIAPGTTFEALPGGWVCPLCGIGKDEFAPEEQFSLISAKAFNGKKGQDLIICWIPIFFYHHIGVINESSKNV